ncbi:nicotinate-nucleotide--dimethylbenzimidazole phosphoribosyltransferase [Actinospica sp. MGRD01-02]|uniref:Nicotinate-nucleotide--dimethylbenzimidazole phosphoribosyltransferase n=1 Tax=Actinospica acidithermotolerans TaxID=2828514 RepID=A0A941IFP0_9ACTN|nr:nicotinate-nucleotide--dimethylbenzimidazole phosphoribosyltransferase [Actinospica acidithermotolerans]MBR7826545.1 nicotinate-nucleotide--dimethylbenzimidazole phosphoribosyltransferase [Actinospica acidithermotolerans]
MEKTDLEKFSENVLRPADAKKAEAAERWAKDLALQPASFGTLEKVACWLAAVQDQCPPKPIERPRLVLFAGDHGIAALDVHGHRVTAQPPGTTAALVRLYAAGGGPASVLARSNDVGVRLVDVSVDCDEAELTEAGVPAEVTAGRVRRGTGRIDVERACTREEADAAFALGRALADAEIDAGADLLIPALLGAGHSTPAAVLVAALTGSDAAAVTGRGSGVDDAGWTVKCAAIRDALRLARPVLADQLELLAVSAGPDFAACVGFILQAASRRTPLLLDGIGATACALLAQRIAFRTPEWCLAAQLSPEPAHRKALDRLSLEPLLDFKIRAGAASGALLALPLVRAAVSVLAETPSYAEADLPEPTVRSAL